MYHFLRSCLSRYVRDFYALCYVYLYLLYAASDYGCTEADLAAASIPAYLTYDGVYAMSDSGTLRLRCTAGRVLSGGDLDLQCGPANASDPGAGWLWQEPGGGWPDEADCQDGSDCILPINPDGGDFPDHLELPAGLPDLPIPSGTQIPLACSGSGKVP